MCLCVSVCVSVCVCVCLCVCVEQSQGKKKPKRPPSSSSQHDVSTTSTPSAVPPEEVTRAVVHALVALRPEDRYRVGSLKLNLTLLEQKYDDAAASLCASVAACGRPGAREGSQDEDECCRLSDQEATAAGGAGEQGEGEGKEEGKEEWGFAATCQCALRRVLGSGCRVLHRALGRAWRWCSSVVTVPVSVPLATLDTLFMHMLPPRVAEYVWQVVIQPYVAGVV